MKALPILLLAIITLISCKDDNIANVDQNAFVYKTEEGTLKLTKDKAFYAALFDERLQPLGQEIDFEEFWIQAQSEGTFLMGKGKTKAGKTEAGIEIIEEDGIFAIGDCTESCSGNGCSHCRLVMGDGCHCSRGSGICNHKITCKTTY